MTNQAALACLVFPPLLPRWYSGAGAWLRMRRTESLLFRLQPLTPGAPKCGLLARDLLSIFIASPPWGFNFVSDAFFFTNEHNHGRAAAS